MISFVIPLEPVAWQRVRRDRHGTVYVPKETRLFENQVRTLARGFYQGVPLRGPLRLTARFIVRRPKRPKFAEPAVRPDLDNYMKALKDSLSGVLWTDDAQVCQYGNGSGKYYDLTGKGPRIEFTVEEIKEEEA